MIFDLGMCFVNVTPALSIDDVMHSGIFAYLNILIRNASGSGRGGVIVNAPYNDDEDVLLLL
jgi:hypothetical protein